MDTHHPHQPYPASAPAAIPLQSPPAYFPMQAQPQQAQPVALATAPAAPFRKSAGWNHMEQDVSHKSCSSYCTCYYFLSFRGILRLLQTILIAVALCAFLPVPSAPSFMAMVAILGITGVWQCITLLRLFLTRTGRLEIMLYMIIDSLCAIVYLITISVATGACNAKQTIRVNGYYPYYNSYNINIDGWCSQGTYLVGIVSCYLLFALYVISFVVQVIRYRSWVPIPEAYQRV